MQIILTDREVDQLRGACLEAAAALEDLARDAEAAHILGSVPTIARLRADAAEDRRLAALIDEQAGAPGHHLAA